MIDKFSTLIHDESVYKDFIDWKADQYDKYLAESKEKRNSIEALIREREKELSNYIRQNMSIKKDEQESQIYEMERNRITNIIETLKEQRDSLDISDRDQMYEFETFVRILQDA